MPAFFAAIAIVIFASVESPEMALMKTSIPESKGYNSLGEEEMSATRVLTHFLVRSFISGFFG